MSATATEPPLELIKTRTNDYWLKPLDQCLPITITGAQINWTNETRDGKLENYRLASQPENMRDYEQDLIARGATCNGTVLQLLSPTAETGHTKLKPASSLNKYSTASGFDTRIQFLDADGVDWAPKLIGDNKEKDADKGYLQSCLKNGATSFDLDIKCCGISRNNRIQWEIMHMRAHGFGNNKRPADDQEFASKVELEKVKKMCIAKSRELAETKRALGELKQVVFDQGCALATMQAEQAKAKKAPAAAAAAAAPAATGKPGPLLIR
jgi:hypothetical protein